MNLKRSACAEACKFNPGSSNNNIKFLLLELWILLNQTMKEKNQLNPLLLLLNGKVTRCFMFLTRISNTFSPEFFIVSISNFISIFLFVVQYSNILSVIELDVASNSAK